MYRTWCRMVDTSILQYSCIRCNKSSCSLNMLLLDLIQTMNGKKVWTEDHSKQFRILKTKALPVVTELHNNLLYRNHSHIVLVHKLHAALHVGGAQEALRDVFCATAGSAIRCAPRNCVTARATRDRVLFLATCGMEGDWFDLILLIKTKHSITN